MDTTRPTTVPLSDVQTDAGSHEQKGSYDFLSKQPWTVSSKPGDDLKEGDVPTNPSVTLTLQSPAPQVTGVSVGDDSQVETVNVIFTQSTGGKKTLKDAPVDSEGQVIFPEGVKSVDDVSSVRIELTKSTDTADAYSVSPSVQGCLKAATTTIVAPTQTTTGLPVPSTTTVTTVSTTGIAVTETVPTTTTTLSTTAGTTSEVGTTTTVAIVTTTTTPTGTTTVICPLTNEMPSQPTELNDVQYSSPTGNPSDALPGREGWQPPVPAKGEPNPQLTIDMGPKTAQLVRVDVTDRTLKIVIVIAYLKDVVVVKVTVQMPPSGSKSVPLSDDGQPVEVDQLVIELQEPKDADTPNYALTASPVGCFEPVLGEW
jgi:hypothetical protein